LQDDAMPSRTIDRTIGRRRIPDLRRLLSFVGHDAKRMTLLSRLANELHKRENACLSGEISEDGHASYPASLRHRQDSTVADKHGGRP
jgi:hypothetical protein